MGKGMGRIKEGAAPKIRPEKTVKERTKLQEITFIKLRSGLTVKMGHDPLTVRLVMTLLL